MCPLLCACSGEGRVPAAYEIGGTKASWGSSRLPEAVVGPDSCLSEALPSSRLWPSITRKDLLLPVCATIPTLVSGTTGHTRAEIVSRTGEGRGVGQTWDDGSSSDLRTPDTQPISTW